MEMAARTFIFPAFIFALATLFGGCGIFAPDSEKSANERRSEVGAQFRPAGVKPVLPELKDGSPFEDYLRYALLNSPEVEQAYYEWASAVYTITVARSLPDPRLTFQMDIQGGFIPSLTPGINFDIPGPGKLATAAEIAAAASGIKFQVLTGKVLSSALALERACWELQFLDAKMKSLKGSRELLSEIEAQARSLNATGKATVQDILRAQIEQERLKTEIDNLEEAKAPLLEKFKASLGLKPGEAAPPPPLSVPEFPTDASMADKLLDEALKNNPDLKAIEAEIKQAEGSLSMARKANIPDFNFGGQLDALAAPVIFRPMAGMTLPIWREKIAAGIAAAQAVKQASESKLSAAQIALAVQCAEKRYLTKEALRNLETLRLRLIPKAKLALDAAKLAYSSNGVDFLTLLEAERSLLNFDIEEAAANLQRNVSTAELALTLAGRLPEEAEFLKVDSLKNSK